jgi:hypothetical protein
MSNTKSLFNSAIILYILFTASQGIAKLYTDSTDVPLLYSRSQLWVVLYFLIIIGMMIILPSSNYEPIVFFMFIYLVVGLIFNILLK